MNGEAADRRSPGSSRPAHLPRARSASPRACRRVSPTPTGGPTIRFAYPRPSRRAHLGSTRRGRRRPPSGRLIRRSSGVPKSGAQVRRSVNHRRTPHLSPTRPGGQRHWTAADQMSRPGLRRSRSHPSTRPSPRPWTRSWLRPSTRPSTRPSPAVDRRRRRGRPAPEDPDRDPPPEERWPPADPPERGPSALPAIGTSVVAGASDAIMVGWATGATVQNKAMRAIPTGMALIERMFGGVLLSHEVPLAVPSAL